MSNVFNIGDEARVTATFKAANGALVDPTEVVVKVRTPEGVETEDTPTRASTGVYYYDLALTAPKKWNVRFVGTGAAVAANERQLNVRESAFEDP
jgi:hypothetical protein